MPKRKLEEMAADLYSDENVRAAVVAHAHELKTVERIEAGELGLPGEQDANIWYARERNKAASVNEVDALKARMAALEEHSGNKPTMAGKQRASGKGKAGRAANTSTHDEE